MDLREKINGRLKESLKEKDQISISTVRLIMAALKDRDIAARAQGKADGIEENEILSLLQSMIKQRQESIKMYNDANREELAQREADEVDVIQGFLPKQLSEDEVKDIIRGIIKEHELSEIKDMGRVMGVLKNDYAGQIDMGKASGLVKEFLS